MSEIARTARIMVASALVALAGAAAPAAADEVAAALEAAAEANARAAKAAEAALAAAREAQAAVDASSRALEAARMAAAGSTSTTADVGKAAASARMTVAAAHEMPYEGHVRCEGEKCQIDLWMTRGFRAFSQCQVCHGLDANGSSFAPSLTAKMREIDRERFMDVVANGYKGQIGVMPPWKENPNVMKYVDQLYAYLMARADKVIPPGKLPRYDR